MRDLSPLSGTTVSCVPASGFQFSTTYSVALPKLSACRFAASHQRSDNIALQMSF